jgi:MFS family permease
MTLGHGHFGIANVALLLGAAGGAVLFVLAELKAASPLIAMATLRDGNVSAGLAMSALVSAVIMATLVVGPFYLSRGLGLDTAAVGIVLSGGPVVAALSGVPAGRLVDRAGARRIIVVGLAAMAAGSVVLTIVPATFGVAGYIAPIVTITAGYALFQAANNTAMLTAIGPEQRGVISGLLNLSRNLGLITGASFMGAVFAFASGASDVTAALPQQVATGMRFTFGVAALLIAVAIALAVARHLQAIGREQASSRT